MNANYPEAMEDHIFHWRSWLDLTILWVMGMDLAWVALWVASLSRIGAPEHGLSYSRVFAVLGGLLLTSHLLARWAQDHLHQVGVRSVFFGAAVLASVLAAMEWLIYAGAPVSLGSLVTGMAQKFAAANIIPSEFWVTLLVLLIWQRGVTLMHFSPQSGAVLTRFQVGVFGFLLYSLVFSATPRHPAEILALGVFFGAGILALGCSQLAQLERTPDARRVRISRAWLLTLALAAFTVLLVGLGGGIAIQGRLGELLIKILLALIGLVLLLLALVAVPIMLLLVFLGRQFGGAFQEIFAAVADVFRALKFLLPAGSAQTAEKVMQTIERGKPIYLWGTLLAVLALVVAAVNLRRWLRRLSEEAESEAGNVPIPNARRGLREAAALLMERFNPRLTRRRWAAARIRWVYAQLMGLCNRLNIPRPAADTPLEFLPVMERVLPDSGEDLRQMTQAYLQVRYGEVPETDTEVEAVLAAWRRVDAAGRRESALRRKRMQEG